MSKIEIEKKDGKAETKTQETQAKEVLKDTPPPEDTTVTWQFRYKKYKEITSIVDPEAPVLKTGQKQKAVIRARNFRLDLDLTDPKDKAKHEHLMRSNQKGSSFWLVKKVDRKEDTIIDRAETLRKLNAMPHHQLLSFFTSAELLDLGINPGSADTFQLIMAIIDNKKLEQ